MEKMKKIKNFVKHHNGRTMYLICVFPYKNETKNLRIDKGDDIEFVDEDGKNNFSFIVNHTKRWGVMVSFVVDVVVTMNGIVCF